MARTGATILIDALVEHGVEYAFGIPGAAVLVLFDELERAPLKTVLTRHEQGAGHMADGYARATGRPGVCIATSGPGATNLVTAIATANMDSIPMLAISGQVKTHLIGNDAFQEADMVGITRPITKHNYLVKDIADLARVVREAFHIATTGRPGPVLIDLPADVVGGTLEGEPDAKMRLPGYRPHPNGHGRQVRKAAEAVNASERPVLYAGGGVISSGACQELRGLARKGGIPVTTTLMGLGAFPESDPLALHMLGMHGAAYANHAVQNCDLLMAVGARFDDRITGKIESFAPRATIVHVDIDPASIGKSVRAHIPVVGDARKVLGELTELVEARERTQWLEQVARWKREFPLRYSSLNGSVMPQAVIEQIADVTAGRAVVCTDVGQHQMWAAQYYTYDAPRSFLSSGGLGTMGFGLPAAIGAQFGRPGETVFVISGDGSIQMNIQEMATAVQHRLPIKIALLNNGYLGMVRQWQQLFFGRRYASTHLAPGNPDFVALARAYGAEGLSVDRPEDVRPALEQAMAVTDRPVLIDFHTAPEENVFPMVPAGEPIDRMLGGLA
jgi:acetolactate synthase-1/2/3 large subunit